MGIKIQLCVAGIIVTCSYPEIGLFTCGLARHRPQSFGLSLGLGLGVLAVFNVTGFNTI